MDLQKKLLQSAILRKLKHFNCYCSSRTHFRTISFYPGIMCILTFSHNVFLLCAHTYPNPDNMLSINFSILLASLPVSVISSALLWGQGWWMMRNVTKMCGNKYYYEVSVPFLPRFLIYPPIPSLKWGSNLLRATPFFLFPFWYSSNTISFQFSHLSPRSLF